MPLERGTRHRRRAAKAAATLPSPFRRLLSVYITVTYLHGALQPTID